MRFRETVAYLDIHKQHTVTVSGLCVYVIEFGVSCRLVCVCVCVRARARVYVCVCVVCACALCVVCARVVSSVQDVKPLNVLRVLRDKYGWQRACHFVMVMCLTDTLGSACIVRPARKKALH
jgi:hypothetical protein